MPKTIEIDPFDSKSVQKAINGLKAYKLWVQQKENKLRLRIAQLGATVASIRFSSAIYNGVNDITVRVDNTGSVAVIYAEGKSVAFIEFGSGAKYGYGHPNAAQFGFGPGTWSESENGKKHWNNEKGWYFGSGEHSYGNPPAMAMAKAVEEMASQLTMIAREVFA